MNRQSIVLLVAACVALGTSIPAMAQGFGGANANLVNGGSGVGAYGQPLYNPGGTLAGRGGVGTYSGGGLTGGGYYAPGYGYGVPNYTGRPLGSFGNIGNPYGAGWYNNPYYGSYGPIGAPANAPVIYGAPVAVPGGYFRLGPLRAQFWQSPSGYYYPWGAGAIGAQQNIYYVNQGATTQVKPPIPTELTDMEKYLQESRDKGRVGDQDYQHLFRRLQDLRSKYARLAAEWDGLLDPSEEERLRKDVDLLASEISMRVHPTSGASSKR